MTTSHEYHPAHSPFPLSNAPSDTSSTPVPHGVGPWPPLDIRALRRVRRPRLLALSKTFGNIPGIPIFTHWDSRVECSDTAVHRSTVAGICGDKENGTYSLAVSNLYRDNEDGGDIIIYTGSGGRKKWSDSVPPKRLRVGPQILDQSWEESRNGALITSLDTGNPIRVVRSWRSRSQYAPLKGYRYDGLYKVAACWMAQGRNGKMVCRCRLERLPDQPPIPLRPVTISTRKREGISYHRNVAADTELEWERIEFHPSPDFQVDTREASVGFSNLPQQRAVSEVSTLINVYQAEQDLKLSPHPPEGCALPRYRWDSERNELVRVQDPQPMLEDLAAADEGEPLLEDIFPADDEDDEVDEHMVEGDITFLPLGVSTGEL